MSDASSGASPSPESAASINGSFIFKIGPLLLEVRLVAFVIYCIPLMASYIHGIGCSIVIAAAIILVTSQLLSVVSEILTCSQIAMEVAHPVTLRAIAAAKKKDRQKSMHARSLTVFDATFCRSAQWQ